jgi:hypothetical protein
MLGRQQQMLERLVRLARLVRHHCRNIHASSNSNSSSGTPAVAEEDPIKLCHSTTIA